ncbi:glycosyltransferase family 2 protein [Siccirubricoccus deserti]
MRVEVAVVIPAYRQPGLLAEAVLSALDQQGAPPTAVVVVDDGCPIPPPPAPRPIWRRRSPAGSSCCGSRTVGFRPRATPGWAFPGRLPRLPGGLFP